MQNNANRLLRPNRVCAECFPLFSLVCLRMDTPDWDCMTESRISGNTSEIMCCDLYILSTSWEWKLHKAEDCLKLHFPLFIEFFVEFKRNWRKSPHFEEDLTMLCSWAYICSFQSFIFLSFLFSLDDKHFNIYFKKLKNLLKFISWFNQVHIALDSKYVYNNWEFSKCPLVCLIPRQFVVQASFNHSVEA